MQSLKDRIRKNKVTLILVVLLLSNLALYSVTASLFADNHKVEVEKNKDQKISYFESGVYIYNVGSYIVDYFKRFSEKK